MSANAPTPLIHAPERARWYWPDGRVALEVEGANGRLVTPDYRHAKKLGLIRSVTSVVSQLDKPGLRVYYRTQDLLAALTLPRNDGESLDAFAKRVVVDADAHAFAARERGIEGHAQIAQWLTGGLIPSREPWDAACANIDIRLQDDRVDRAALSCERPLLWTMQTYQVAGTPDVVGLPLLADIKTVGKDVWDQDRQPYEEWAWQISAYRDGYCRLTGRYPERVESWVVCRETGRLRVIRWEEKALARAVHGFELLLRLSYLRQPQTFDQDHELFG